MHAKPNPRLTDDSRMAAAMPTGIAMMPGISASTRKWSAFGLASFSHDGHRYGDHLVVTKKRIGSMLDSQCGQRFTVTPYMLPTQAI